MNAHPYSSQLPQPVRLPQLHYTSAASADTGTGSGFRFTAVSPGVDPGTLRQAEPLLGYEPPSSAPARPTQAELAAFPVSFGFRRLPDGTGLLSNTVYTGADYSGRYGNFHAHAVLLPPGGELPGGLLPIDAWRSPDWQSSTPQDPEPAPLAGLRPGERFGREVLTRFARGRTARLAAFLADVRRLFDAEPGAPLVVVDSDAEQIARWVALACSVLPRARAAALTFTTYTQRPYLAEQQIVGVPPDAEFGFTQAELTYQYRVHHCLGGPSSPPGDDPWAAVAAGIWLAGQPELLQRADPADPFAAGPLAALALSAGVPLDVTGRRAAAAWAVDRADRGDPAFWQTFLGTLLTEPPGGQAEAGQASGGLARGGPPDSSPVSGGPAARDRTTSSPGPGGSFPGGRRLDHTVSGGPGPGSSPAAGGSPSRAPGLPGTGDDETRPGAEMLLALLTALDTYWPPEVTDPLTRALTRAAVLDGGPVPDLERIGLTATARTELGRELATGLAAALDDPGLPVERALRLLGTAHQLAAPYDSALPALSARLAHHLLDAAAPPRPTAAAVAAALTGDRAAGLRTALLDRLADVALDDDPRPVVGAVEGLFPPWAQAELAGYPHLRVAAAVGRYAGDNPANGLGLMHRLLREAGPSSGPNSGLSSGPSSGLNGSVLRTAYRLAWPEHPPTVADARLLLHETPGDLLADSGLDHDVVAVALNASALDAEAPDLAADLLRLLPSGPDPRTAAALSLLCLSEEIRTGQAPPGFTARVVARLPDAQPLEEQVQCRLDRDLAARLLSGRAPLAAERAGPGRLVLLDEQRQLVLAGDGPLLRGYLREASAPLRAARPPDDPRHVAACFVAWNSHGAGGGGWDDARHKVLEEVLRPAVRRMPDAALDTVEEYLAAAGAAWSDAWQQWHRPGLVRRWNRRRATGAKDRGRGGPRRGPWSPFAPGSPEPPDGTRGER